ncbi:MAG: hypothetical protein J2P37_22515, partial [Ktedonobacteraceae bacterium]|nr:hypothetical protein [Ktedonobacteraceae bacterium]
MTTSSTTTQFPYGQCAVDPMVHQRYRERAPQLAERYPLPAWLPRHHPLLQRVCGIWQVSDAPAPWWTDFLASLERTPNACLLPVLRDISPHEFRGGAIQDRRWRQFKQEHGAWLKEHQLKSPKFGHLLEATDWNWCFQQRGPQETPTPYDLVLSCAPE